MRPEFEESGKRRSSQPSTVLSLNSRLRGWPVPFGGTLFRRIQGRSRRLPLSLVAGDPFRSWLPSPGPQRPPQPRRYLHWNARGEGNQWSHHGNQASADFAELLAVRSADPFPRAAPRLQPRRSSPHRADDQPVVPPLLQFGDGHCSWDSLEKRQVALLASFDRWNKHGSVQVLVAPFARGLRCEQ